MTNTLSSPSVQTVLERLFAAAELDDDTRSQLPTEAFSSVDAQQRADAMENIYMPISQSGGNLLYSLIRASRPDTVIEFGTSYGISTIYLAAAVTDNGKGRVFGTEMSATKLAAAKANLAAAGVAGPVTILAGNALDTLADIPGPISFVLLDGWKNLCLPVLQLLEPKLAPGALVIGDDTNFPTMSTYLDYVRRPASGYVNVSFPVEDGMEISCRTGVDATP